MEDATLECMADGDTALTLVRGGSLLEPDHLPDGIHPGDEGHQILAVAFGGAVREALEAS